MLMKLGPLTFEIAPVSLMEYSHSHQSDFVAKPVLGARPPLEWVGEGEESWSIKAKLFPEKFGGLDALQQLQQARTSGKPQYFARGDGKAMGWVVIDRISESSSYIGQNGVGQVIEVDIAVRRASKPSSGSFFSILSAVSGALATGFAASAVNALR